MSGESAYTPAPEVRVPFSAEVSDEHSKTLRAAAALEPTYRSRISIRGFTVESDQPEKLGGTNTAPTPMELIIAGVEACIAVVITTVAQELGIRVSDISSYVIARQDTRGQKGTADVQPYYYSFHLTLVIGTELSDTDALRALTARVERRCPALNLIKDANTSVTVDWNFTRTPSRGAAEHLANAALGYTTDPAISPPDVFANWATRTTRRPAAPANQQTAQEPAR